MPTYPVNPDYWTEISTTPMGGHWTPNSYTVVEIDLVVKAVGIGSIHVKTTSPIESPYAGATFYIDSGSEFDGTKPNAQLRFKMDLRTSVDPGFTGQCSIFLVDDKGSNVWNPFTQSPNNQFADQSFPLGADKGWIPIRGSFDWSKIKVITISCDMVTTQLFCAGEFNIDELYFYYEYAQPILLTVKSEPSGKQMILDGSIPGTTPVTWGVSLGQHTIKAEPNGFQKWEDNTTNPERTLNVDSPNTITAYYLGGGGQAIWPLIAIAGGAIVLFLVWQYRK